MKDINRRVGEVKLSRRWWPLVSRWHRWTERGRPAHAVSERTWLA